MGVAACVGRACVLRPGGGAAGSACVACVAVVCGHLIMIKMLYKFYLYHSTRVSRKLSDFVSQLSSSHTTRTRLEDTHTQMSDRERERERERDSTSTPLREIERSEIERAPPPPVNYFRRTKCSAGAVIGSFSIYKPTFAHSKLWFFSTLETTFTQKNNNDKPPSGWAPR